MKIKFPTLRTFQPDSLTRLSHTLTQLIEGRLWLKVLIGMVLGVALGILLGPTVAFVEPRTALMIGEWVALPGQIFLSLIQMIVVPLVVASIIRGLVAGENINQLKKLGLFSMVFFVFTTTLAITIGISLTYLIKPGNFIDPSQLNWMAPVSNASPASLSSVPLSSKIIELIPSNPVGSMLNLEMLQIVLFAIIVGIALLTISASQSRPVLELLGSIQEVCMAIVKWAMRLAPYAVFGLLAQIVSKIGIQALIGMSVYMATVLLGLFLLYVLYCTIIFFVAKFPLILFIKSVKDVQLLAFSTSSSAAVMPLSMKTAEESLKVRPSVCQFVIPMGTTINMAGTALYQGVATVFLAQVFGINLSLGSLVLVVVTAVGASIGSPGTPGVGIVILSMVLNAAGVPISGIALIMGVDRILDMSRTALNVTGDITASVVLDTLIRTHSSGNEKQAV